METKVEILEENQKRITVTVDAKEVDSRIKKQYKDFAYKYNFPGFRKGKAPRPVIDNMLGAQAVVGAVTDDVVNELYPLAMDEHDLIAMGTPDFDFETELVEAGKPFTFTATVATRPEYELDSYEPVAVKLPPAQATEKEIDSQIEELREYYYDFKDSPANTKVKDGSFVELAMKATDAEGNAIDSLATDNRLYELGRGLFPDDFDEALKGMVKGDVKTFDIDMSQPCAMGQGMKDAGTVTFEVTINQLKRKILPELDDAWAKETAGFESLAAMRDMIAQNINAQKEQVMPRMRENEALCVLQERLQGEPPAELCEAEEQNLLQNFFSQLQESGMSFDEYLAQTGLGSDTFKDDLKKQAADVVAQDLALDAWARNAGIQATDDDITAEFERSGVDDPKKVEKQWRADGRISMLRAGIRRQRALEQILDTLVEETLEDASDDGSEKE